MKKYLHALLLFAFTLITSLGWQQTAAQGRVDIGKSFANMSKLKTGGTYNPGDTVEIRVTIAVKTQTTATIIDEVQVTDVVPAKTTYIPGSMRIATNEGINYKGPFTEAFDTDQARNNAGNIIINIGNKATNSIGGRIKSDSSRPTFYGSACIMMVCYKVRINPGTAYYDTIKIRGSVRYRPISPSGAIVNHLFPEYNLFVFPNNGYCPNGSDVSATSDFGGTFGTGTSPNRAAPLNFTTSYIKQNISTGQPNDYYYAIVKNSSPTSLTNPNPGLPNSANRVFSLWDIAGDHTDAVNTSQGNAPPSAAAGGGYMVLINASYNTNVAYQETLSNLCPNTYYEFSAWFRNVCPRCGCDSIGRGSGTSGYIRGPGNDSSGVKPNLNFEVDGLAYYTTGDIKYDRGEPWKKYGFTFVTRPGQTTANFVIRNNSPGGGGNDWAIDDIKIAHCGPDLKMNYHPYVIGCRENRFAVSLSDTIRFVYNSYTHFKWQKSNVGGTIWNDMTGPGTSGIGTPVLVNGMYQYVTNLPTFWATAADSGTYYRVIVATTAANLSTTTCSYKDGSATMVSAITCGVILNGTFTQFRGTLTDKKAYLTWSTANEENLVHYVVEKSRDGRNFELVDKVLAKNLPFAYYNFTDPQDIAGDCYYRLKMVQTDGLFKYSNLVLVSATNQFAVKNIENPFSNKINADIILPEADIVNIILHNDKGQQVKSYKKELNKGFNQVTLEGLSGLANGMYFISFEYRNLFERRKLMR
ncbi:MAG: T9SS type A sorting domain-containing protein [Sphingobacteriaceae bacterium]|nr:MAG: T9SS type A sorting domain-containing protein [Sphingobacteriaceae bacterium]